MISERQLMKCVGLVGVLLVIISLALPGSKAPEDLTTTVIIEEPVVAPNPDGSYQPLQYTEEDVYFMAEAIYFEAASEPIQCQIYVAQVVDTRRWSHLYPNTVEEVVWQDRQFSYTKDGKHEKMLDNKSRWLAIRIAREVLSGVSPSNGQGALFYFNPDLANPGWQHDYELAYTCGKHNFYTMRTTKWG